MLRRTSKDSDNKEIMMTIKSKNLKKLSHLAWAIGLLATTGVVEAGWLKTYGTTNNEIVTFLSPNLQGAGYYLQQSGLFEKLTGNSAGLYSYLDANGNVL